MLSSCVITFIVLLILIPVAVLAIVGSQSAYAALGWRWLLKGGGQLNTDEVLSSAGYGYTGGFDTSNLNWRRDAAPGPQQQAGLSIPQLAGIVAGALTLIMGATIAAIFYHRRKARALAGSDAKGDNERSPSRTKSLESLTSSLEASSNPWNPPPVNTVTSPQLPAHDNGRKSVSLSPSS